VSARTNRHISRSQLASVSRGCAGVGGQDPDMSGEGESLQHREDAEVSALVITDRARHPPRSQHPPIFRDRYIMH